MPGPEARWFFMSRPGIAAVGAELRPLLSLALPIIGAQLAFMAIGVTDTLLAGRLSAGDLAAVAVGANIWMLFFIAFMGIGMAMSPIVAQRVGAGAAGRLPAVVQHALALALLLGLVWGFAQWGLAGPLVSLLGLPPATETLAAGYLRAAAYAAPLNCLVFVLRYVGEGLGASRAMLMAGVVGFAVNAVADYGFMYGAFGLPRLGAVGCGWATACASVAMFLWLALAFARSPALRRASPWRRWTPGWRRTVPEILRLGLPISLIWLAEAGMFAGAGLLAARIGETAAAAHQIAINVAAVAFMVPMGIGLAATARIGQAAGAGDRAAVAARSIAAIGVAVAFALGSALVMLTLPAAIVGLYTEAGPVAGMATGFLFYAALFQLFDGVQATASGCLRGLKDTRAPMLITVIAYWLIGMPLAVITAFAWNMGPRGLWYGLIAGLAAAATGLSLRLLRRLRAVAD